MLVNSVFLLCSVMEWYVIPEMIPTTTMAIATSICNFYLVLYAFGLLTTLTEWKEIDTTPLKKILYTFTFPIFIFTYVPISIVALFRKIEWKPITHSVCKSIEEVARR